MSAATGSTLARLQDTDLSAVEHARDMGLDDAEYQRAQQVLGRVPNKVELGCFAAMWSEHCSYKSSRVHLRRLPTTGPRVLVGPGENAGVVDVGEGWAVAFKVESHNHPSYIEPYQGAATGVGGILRDVFTMGARPIAAMNLLRFGRPEHPKTAALLAGVVKGIGGYGNCFGVPTVYSSTDFDARYDGNILVNAFALGVLRADAIWKGTASGVGNPVMYVGAKTGRDGIHGATMASDSFSEGEEQERPTVQVGDPFKEKLLMEACMELFAAAPEQGGLLVGIQDMGAAGLTSSCFEMASRAGSGVRIDLDRVPTREQSMSAYELMLSESQERMLLVAKRGCEDAVRAIFSTWDLDCVTIGTVTDDGMVRLVKGGVEVAVLPARELADDAPRYERPFAAPPASPAPAPTWSSIEIGARAHVCSPALAPKSWIYRRYDREVGAGTLLDGSNAAAALVRIPHTQRAVAMALCCVGRWCSADPREGARRALIEGVLRTSCVGALPIGATDCLNYGNPRVPEVMGSLVEGIEGIREACLALDVPVVSGNVSLYNSTDERAIHPTPAVGVVGLVEDFAKALARPARAGDTMAVIGWPPAGPTLDLGRVRRLGELLRAMRLEGESLEAQPVMEGGLVSTLVELARRFGGGLFASLPSWGDAASTLHSEEAVAAAVVLPPERLQEAHQRARVADVPFEVLGALGGHHFVVAAEGAPLFEWATEALFADLEAVIPRIVRGERA
ncbi:MAG: phosphoribosylformylglycinamidine synthase subunit PurL [Deltaproteobacteria bacterium]|nr:phosphoribosylformylglycinamidine synthase subunit PurL [Deltaproteobacteria bacterium]